MASRVSLPRRRRAFHPVGLEISRCDQLGDPWPIKFNFT
jgi:hypothetical protein